MSDGAFEVEEAAIPDGDAKQSSPLWVDELPFISMLVLALGGAAYASLSPGSQPDVLANSRAGLRGFLHSCRLATCED